MKLLKWALVPFLGVSAFFGLLLFAALAPAQTNLVRLTYARANLADELVLIFQEQGKAWGVDWALWAAFWGHRDWQLPIPTRLERLQAARQGHRSSSRAEIDVAWQADARAYLAAQLEELVGPPPTTTDRLALAIQTRVTADEWAVFEELRAVYTEVEAMTANAEDAVALAELTEQEIYRVFLRALDGEYTFPVQGQYDPFIDSWGVERPQNEAVGVSGRHHGTDIMAPRGTPVVAVTDSVIEVKEWNRLGGWTITLKGDDGLLYYYAHLDSFGHVSSGQVVERGAVIGYIGTTGEGPEGTASVIMESHLHFGMYVPGSAGQPDLVTNPFPYLRSWERRN